MRVFFLSNQVCCGIRERTKLEPNVINVQTTAIKDKTSEQNKLMVAKLREEKDFLKYYYPGEKFVPVEELPFVCKSCIVFYPWYYWD